MTDRKVDTYATVIGDLIGSRRSADRRAVHRAVTAALDHVAADVPPTTPLAITAGDEFQGTYATLGEAVHTTLLLQLRLLPEVPVRFGIGWGEVTVLDPERNTQDGPGWWAARDAIDEIEGAQQRSGLRLLRTAYHRSSDAGPAPEPVNAALACRDHLLGLLDDRSLRILGGLMAGETRAALADREGISASAVSQRAARDGLDVVLFASRHLAHVA